MISSMRVCWQSTTHTVSACTVSAGHPDEAAAALEIRNGAGAAVAETGLQAAAVLFHHLVHGAGKRNHALDTLRNQVVVIAQAVALAAQSISAVLLYASRSPSPSVWLFRSARRYSPLHAGTAG